ncbi:hypothetical protein MEA186_35724, partial [Mesorhizobium amorphae CCNWGS0123]
EVTHREGAYRQIAARSLIGSKSEHLLLSKMFAGLERLVRVPDAIR